jgi:uncharacterized coiled-coil DUF342 family protein
VKADRAKLLESSITIKSNLERQVQELRSQLETEKKRVEEVWEELEDSEKVLAEIRSENSELKKTCDELRSEVSGLEEKLAAAPTENPKSAQKAAPGVEFPEAAEIYNQFKAENPKTKTTYKEVVAILARVQAMIEESWDTSR